MFGVPSNGRWHSNYAGTMLQFGETARKSGDVAQRTTAPPEASAHGIA
jgi:hypothetical protein